MRIAVDEILKYFDDHPRAADTAEWIGRWWIQRHDIWEASVQAALDRLVLLGLVQRHESPGQPSVYSRAPKSKEF